jgi:hypothetical protein
MHTHMRAMHYYWQINGTHLLDKRRERERAGAFTRCAATAAARVKASVAGVD